MSGRSAYVRKKITETKGAEKAAGGSGRARSINSSDDAATVSDYSFSMRQDTGIGTTNARFLKFSEPIRESEPLSSTSHYVAESIIGSDEGGSGVGGHGSGTSAGHYTTRPLEDFAYARARRPIVRTEDVSGIEKSGLRSAVDRKSEGVRRGLAKAFSFGKKGKNGIDQDQLTDLRPLSVATMRPPFGPPPNTTGSGSETGTPVDSREAMLAAQQQMQQQIQQQQMFMFQQQQQQQQQKQHQHQHQQMQMQSMHMNSNPSPVSSPLSHSPPIGWADMPAGQFLNSPPPASKLPPLPTQAAPSIRRWIGSGRPVQRWNKLRKDPELWDPNGDVLVFFGRKGQQPRPNPSFRLSSHIIEATESRFLITLLREGSTEEDLHGFPPSPMAGPGFHHSGSQQQQQRNASVGGSVGGIGRPYGHVHPSGPGGHHLGPMTPPISEDASLVETDGQISYEMYFPPPSNLSRLDQLRHHITTRNVFALLYHASLVGLSLYQALSDLHARLEIYMPPDTDNVGTLINYLTARGIDDVRNDPDAAVSLLAWSEDPEVRWEEGWRESFLHCAGMYTVLESCPVFKSVTPITRGLLERACLETQLRVQAAEERLAEFSYPDLWSLSPGAGGVMTAAAIAPARAAGDRLQKFLISYYMHVYGRWPPLPPPDNQPGTAPTDPEDAMWLTRSVALDLQRDFAALYDYLVDRDIVWDGSEARAGRKWMLVSASGNKAFTADTPDLPITDLLVEFDNRLLFPHIPHPYPLVPEAVPPSTGPPLQSQSGGGAGNPRVGAIERRVQLAYTVATNMLLLGSEFHQSDLIEAFAKFEKSDHIGEVDPATARRGRWILLYGILQTLASVSVGAPNMRFCDGVDYHLSPRLKGARMPPWRNAPLPPHGLDGDGFGDEAAHELSHCWLVPRTWNVGGGHQNHDPRNGLFYEEGSVTSSSAGSSPGDGHGPGGHGHGRRQRNSILLSTSSTSSYSFPRPPTRGSASGPAGVGSSSSSGMFEPHSMGNGGSPSLRMQMSSSALCKPRTVPPVASRGMHAVNSSSSNHGNGIGLGMGIAPVDEEAPNDGAWIVPPALLTRGARHGVVAGSTQGKKLPILAYASQSLAAESHFGPEMPATTTTHTASDDAHYAAENSETSDRRDQRQRMRQQDRDRSRDWSRDGSSGGGGRNMSRPAPLLSGDDESRGAMTPLIRDFDVLDLDVVDDHDP